MKIGNVNENSNFNLACIICGNKENLSNVAHRLKKINRLTKRIG
jgi:malonyl CoA-acyl carrier protein transacylase